MANKDDEQILVVKSEILFKNGVWHGLKTDNLDYYVDLIKNNYEFKRRGDVETDNGYQQIIPYIVFNFNPPAGEAGDKYFAYKYLEKAGEQRLINGKYQLGVGGHVNKEDIKEGKDVLEEGMMREWDEEVDFKGNLISKKLVGIINDDSGPVEEVHLGLVFCFEGDSPDIQIKEIDKMEGKLFSIEELGNINQSPWMKIVFENYLKKNMSAQGGSASGGKKIIGIVGEMGSGKDTFCEYVKNNYKDVYFLRFSDGLTEALKVFFNDIKREDQQWLSTVLRERFGQDILVKALIKKANNIKEGIIILNGVRRPDDFNALSEIGGKLVYITADIKKRWERVILRKEKADDDVPFEKFLEMGKAEAESLISVIGAKADFKINNDSSKENLYKEIQKIIESV